MRTPQIQDFMTATPRSIGKDQSLAAAHRLMRQHRIRHLPVLDGGKLVGILSLRDLYFVETLESLQPEQISVADAMTADPYTTHPSANVTDIAADMAVRGYGSVVVVERGQVVGVFTTTDALRALSTVCGELAQSTTPPRTAAHS